MGEYSSNENYTGMKKKGKKTGGGRINTARDKKAKQLTSTVTFWMQSTKWLVISMDLYCIPKMAAKYVQLG